MTDQHFSNFRVQSKPMRVLNDLVDSMALGWGLRFSISNKLPGILMLSVCKCIWGWGGGWQDHRLSTGPFFLLETI